METGVEEAEEKVGSGVGATAEFVDGDDVVPVGDWIIVSIGKVMPPDVLGTGNEFSKDAEAV